MRRLAAEADAFFPLALLHLGHHANLLWGWQVQFVLSTVLAGGLLLLIVSGSSWAGPRKMVLAGGIYRAAAALRRRSRGPGPRIVALALRDSSGAPGPGGAQRPSSRPPDLVVASLALLPAALYFRDYRAAAHHAIEGGLSASLTTALQFLSLMLGPSAAQAVGRMRGSWWPSC